MGLFNYMKKRRERESAVPGGLPTGEDTGLGLETSPQTEVGSVNQAAPESSGSSSEPSGSSSETSAVPGLEGLGDLGQVLKQALSGNPTVSVSGESQVVNLQGRGEELRNSILETLKSHGIDAEKGQAVGINDPEVAEQIMSRLSSAGLDPARVGGPQAFGLGAGAAGGAAAAGIGGGDSISQLERLGKLHEQGMINDAEFAAAKRKLLGD